MWSLAPVATKLEDCARVARPLWDSELWAPTGRSPATWAMRAGEEDLQVPWACCDWASP